jgi:hypothetical protein
MAIIWTFIGDLLRMFGLGGTSTIAMVAALGVLAPWLLLPRTLFVKRGVEPVTAGARGLPLVLWLFGGWVATSMLLVGFTQQGIQNACLYLVFILTMAYAARVSSDGTASLLLRGLRVAAFAGSLLWLPTVVTDGLGQDGLLLSRGAVANICLIGIIASIGLHKRKPWERVLPYYFAVVIGMTLGRLPLAVAAALLVATVFAERGNITRKLVVRVVSITTIAAVVFFNYPPLQQRFLDNDGQTLGGLEIGTSGRTALWEALLNELDESTLLTGRGAGTAESTITDTFQHITQPHSDYLRVLNDFGVIGLVLFSASLLFLLVGAVRRWREAPHEFRPIHLSAAAAVLTIAIFAALDNMIIYIFVMVPFAAIIGASLSRPGVSPTSERQLGSSSRYAGTHISGLANR